MLEGRQKMETSSFSKRSHTVIKDIFYYSTCYMRFMSSPHFCSSLKLIRIASFENTKLKTNKILFAICINQASTKQQHNIYYQYQHLQFCSMIMLLTFSSFLASLKKFREEEFECTICLEPCTDTLVNPECNHRFCGKCIKESLQKCNHECPTCRVHIPTYIIEHVAGIRNLITL